MIIWAVFGAWSNWPNQKVLGDKLLLFVLLLILGWELFGPPVHN